VEARPWQRHYDYSVPLGIRYPRIPAHELLSIPTNSFPDKPATNFYGTEMSFWELHQQVRCLANALAPPGVRKGDRVGIHLPNSPQYVIAYYAVISLGAIVVNIKPMYTLGELTAVVRTTGISTLITFDLMLPHVHSLCEAVDIPRVVVTRITDYIKKFPPSTPADLELEPGWHYFSQLLESCSITRPPKVTLSPEDPALIQFTGGTTGVPKGAVLTHANLVAATLQVSLWGERPLLA
jgi:long-chain acyl-CoA synthetase